MSADTEEAGAEDKRQPSVSISTEMQKAFLDYAVSVVVSRALPDVRDGLKPVHRRIVFGMDNGGYHSSKQHKKSARAVGDVMGKYHPHGDQAIYDALVRLAQEFVMRYPLIDGQGNFGSLDGDPPAAMRYTESRMSKLAHELVRDIDKDTVDFQPNYDGKELEPKVLPARFPNVLVNGQTGIAVGMATNIPPHNLVEVMNACLLVLDKPEAGFDEVSKILRGPDFPTKGKILGRGGIKSAYETGRGSITMAGEASIEEMKAGKQRIVITELPYLVNKERFVVSIKDLVEDEKKPLTGVSDLRDESNRDGIRIVVEVKKEGDANVILNRLRKETDLVKNWSYNAVCLDSRGKPREMPLLDILREFVAFRREVVERRTIFDLNKARDDLHKQIALYAATSKIDDVVAVIRKSSDADQARLRLMEIDFPTAGAFAQLLREADPDIEPGENFRLDVDQADAILALQLRTLTGLEREKVAGKARDLSASIRGLVNILNDRKVLDAVVRLEMEEIRNAFPEKRLTKIEAGEFEELADEDLIERKDVIVNITASGYVKRTDVAAFKEQKRGGVGKSGMDTKDDDYVVNSFICTTRTPLVFFTNKGLAYALRAWQLPEAAPSSRGRALVNFLEMKPGESITTALALPEDKAELAKHNLMFVTANGYVRRNEATDFESINKNGKIAIKLDDPENNRLVSVLLLKPDDNVLLASSSGMSVRFKADIVRVFASRESEGVRGIVLQKGDKVVSASVLQHVEVTQPERLAYLAKGTATWKEVDAVTKEEKVLSYTLDAIKLEEMRMTEQMILTISERGFGKRSSAYEFRITNRDVKGVAAASLDHATGPLVACFPVRDSDGLVLVTDSGQTIRIAADDIRYVSRTGKGVRLFRLPPEQRIVSVSVVGNDVPIAEAAAPAQA